MTPERIPHGMLAYGDNWELDVNSFTEKGKRKHDDVHSSPKESTL
jgi:hypothetical protein